MLSHDIIFKYINYFKNYIFYNLHCYFLNFLIHAKNYRIKTMNHNSVKKNFILITLIA